MYFIHIFKALYSNRKDSQKVVSSMIHQSDKAKAHALYLREYLVGVCVGLTSSLQYWCSSLAMVSQ